MSLNLTCLVYLSCGHFRCVNSKGQTDPTVLEALSRRKPWSHLASGQDTNHSQLSPSWHCHAITAYNTIYIYIIVLCDYEYIHNLKQKIKNRKNGLSRLELRTETQSWRSSGSASVLLTSSSNLMDSGWLQQASTCQNTLLTPGRGCRASKA